MPAKKNPAKEKQQPTISISNCSFESKADPMTIELALAIAEAARENAKAIAACAAAIKGPDCMLKVGN